MHSGEGFSKSGRTIARALGPLLGATLLVLGCTAGPARSPANTEARVGAPSTVAVAPNTSGAPRAVDHSSAVVPVSAVDPQWGEPTAPVTIVEFGDVQCPFTARAEATLAAIATEYGPKKVRIVWKHLPLPFHGRARPAQEASAAVFGLGGQPAFWKFRERLLQNQADLSDDRLLAWAVEAGVSAEQYRAALHAKTYAHYVDEGMALAERIGANGTPTFRINGVRLSGAQPYEKFKDIVDQQLLEADKLVSSGTPAAEVYVALTNRNYWAPAPVEPGAPEEDDTVWKVPVSADDPSRGPADALVTIVERSDFQCPFCKRVEPTLTRILSEHPKDVRLVWKDNPLPFHARAMPAAILARMAYEQKGSDGFWRAHAALFESHPELEDEDLESIAVKVGLRWPLVKQAMVNPRFSAKIQDSIELANALQARGTPHFFINGVRLSGAQPYEKFQELVDEQLTKARELVERGTPRSAVYSEISKTAKEPPGPERKTAPSVDASSPVRGNPKAEVVIQVWSDFQCPFCKRALPTLSELEKEYGKQVKIVWRNLPLPMHAQAPLAAEAAQEVFEQKGSKGFWSYHDALFEGQAESGLERAHLEELAAGLGVDMVKFRGALDSGKHRAKLDADQALASALGIHGTPAFLINDYFVSGAQPVAVFKQLVRRALADKKGVAKRSSAANQKD